MRIAYEGQRIDLIDFLFINREIFSGIETVGSGRFLFGEPLHYIDSAGGLSYALQQYSNQLDED